MLYEVITGKMYVAEHDEAGQVRKEHELPFKYSMMLPAFKGIDAVFGIEGLTNPRGFILIDAYQRNPKFNNIYGVGVCVARITSYNVCYTKLLRHTT